MTAAYVTKQSVQRLRDGERQAAALFLERRDYTSISREVTACCALRKGAMDGGRRRKRRAAAGLQGPRPEEGEDDQEAEDGLFTDPFSALVKNCNLLHIVGPACIFLKQGFSQTVVRSRTAGGVTPHYHLYPHLPVHPPAPPGCVDPFPPLHRGWHPFSSIMPATPSIHLPEQVRQLNAPAVHIKSGRTRCSMETID